MRIYSTVFVFLVLLITIASALSDSEFEEFFRDDFDEEVSKIRVRRSNLINKRKGIETDGSSSPQEDNVGDKKRKTRRSCCGDNDDLKLLWNDQSEKDLKKECFDQARKATEVNTKRARMMEEYEGFFHGNKTKDEYICAVQCIGQKQQVLDHMGNVNKEKMGDYVKRTYSSEPWKADIADKVLEKCFEETQKPSEGQVSTDNGSVTNGRSIEAKCNSNGISFIHCLWREMQLNCPADKLRESRKCNRLRDRLRLRESGIKDGTVRSLF